MRHPDRVRPHPGAAFLCPAHECPGKALEGRVNGKGNLIPSAKTRRSGRCAHRRAHAPRKGRRPFTPAGGTPLHPGIACGDALKGGETFWAEGAGEALCVGRFRHPRRPRRGSCIGLEEPLVCKRGAPSGAFTMLCPPQEASLSTTRGSHSFLFFPFPLRYAVGGAPFEGRVPGGVHSAPSVVSLRRVQGHPSVISFPQPCPDATDGDPAVCYNKDVVLVSSKGCLRCAF